mmetsp:Transcript_107452/g.309341  ORF Transcript_107452/g.309341 Transcript_107452/m.309341 type:complete len:273 (-) Transcript_107452:194-1012(-)
MADGRMEARGAPSAAGPGGSPPEARVALDGVEAEGADAEDDLEDEDAAEEQGHTHAPEVQLHGLRVDDPTHKHRPVSGGDAVDRLGHPDRRGVLAGGVVHDDPGPRLGAPSIVAVEAAARGAAIDANGPKLDQGRRELVDDRRHTEGADVHVAEGLAHIELRPVGEADLAGVRDACGRGRRQDVRVGIAVVQTPIVGEGHLAAQETDEGGEAPSQQAECRDVHVGRRRLVPDQRGGGDHDAGDDEADHEARAPVEDEGEKHEDADGDREGRP